MGLWSTLHQFTGPWCENVWEPVTYELPLSLDAYILRLKLWFWCEHLLLQCLATCCKVYHYNCIFFLRYTFWPPTSVAFPLHTIKVQNTPRTHIEDKSSACCLLVWHQIPFIRALQRLQNPPDELNHCLCLFTWYVTYKCTKYKTFKDKCFTQKEENFLSNQSKCYGFQLRCNCKVLSGEKLPVDHQDYGVHCLRC